MFGIKNLALFFAVFLAAATIVKCKKAPNPLPPPICGKDCRILMKCDPYSNNELVWSIVDGQCRGFKSMCLFEYENCARFHYCQTLMTATTYDDCKPYCDPPSCANQMYSPVCARYSYKDWNNDNIDDNIQYSNECEMKKTACEQMKPYTDFKYGVC